MLGHLPRAGDHRCRQCFRGCKRFICEQRSQTLGNGSGCFGERVQAGCRRSRSCRASTRQLVRCREHEAKGHPQRPVRQITGPSTDRGVVFGGIAWPNDGRRVISSVASARHVESFPAAQPGLLEGDDGDVTSSLTDNEAVGLWDAMLRSARSRHDAVRAGQ